jgi:hypothetical protein
LVNAVAERPNYERAARYLSDFAENREPTRIEDSHS